MGREPSEFDGALVEAARNAWKNSHAPYSKMAAGAAVLDSEGNVYSGCTVEIATYTGTVHAEQAAVAAALAAGAKDLVRIAVYPGNYPCGVCRQFLLEFNPEFIVVFELHGQIETVTLGELFPNIFGRVTLQLPPNL
jgi:cytidine deaminase